MRRVYAWRNNPWIISLGSSQQAITWEEHREWFQRMLADTRHLLLIIESDGGVGAGTVRLDRTDEQRAVVTIYLLHEFTGRGLGVQALSDACLLSFTRWPIETIHAYIREDNRPSLSAFAKAGFVDTGHAPDCPAGHCEMVLHRP